MPGLVVTVYNSGRSRDLSHYEKFAAYHRTLYRHVEATGATPFAPRARDRALHAVLVALARHRIPGRGRAVPRRTPLTGSRAGASSPTSSSRGGRPGTGDARRKTSRTE